MTCDGNNGEKLMTLRDKRKLTNENKRTMKAEMKAERKVKQEPAEEKAEVVGKPKKKIKKFKIPAQLKRFCKRANKKDDLIVAQYLTSKGQIKFKLCKIIGGDVIVVNNKVHKLDPQCLWRHGKYFWYIIREIDRRPVSNKDYPAVKAAGMDTDADTSLIKAVLGAVKKNKKELGDKKWLVLGAIGLAVVGVIIYMFSNGAA